MSTLIWAVAWGLMGPVSATACEAETPDCRMVIETAWLAWLVTMKTTGPAPRAPGETDTRWLSMYTVTFTGLGGLGRFAKCVLLPPHAASVTAVSASMLIVRLRATGLVTLLTRNPKRQVQKGEAWVVQGSRSER